MPLLDGASLSKMMTDDSFGVKLQFDGDSHSLPKVFRRAFIWASALKGSESDGGAHSFICRSQELSLRRSRSSSPPHSHSPLSEVSTSSSFAELPFLFSDSILVRPRVELWFVSHFEAMTGTNAYAQGTPKVMAVLQPELDQTQTEAFMLKDYGVPSQDGSVGAAHGLRVSNSGVHFTTQNEVILADHVARALGMENQDLAFVPLVWGSLTIKELANMGIPGVKDLKASISHTAFTNEGWRQWVLCFQERVFFRKKPSSVTVEQLWVARQVSLHPSQLFGFWVVGVTKALAEKHANNRESMISVMASFLLRSTSPEPRPAQVSGGKSLQTEDELRAEASKAIRNVIAGEAEKKKRRSTRGKTQSANAAVADPSEVPLSPGVESMSSAEAGVAEPMAIGAIRALVSRRRPAPEQFGVAAKVINELGLALGSLLTLHDEVETRAEQALSDLGKTNNTLTTEQGRSLALEGERNSLKDNLRAKEGEFADSQLKVSELEESLAGLQQNIKELEAWKFDASPKLERLDTLEAEVAQHDGRVTKINLDFATERCGLDARISHLQSELSNLKNEAVIQEYLKSVTPENRDGSYWYSNKKRKAEGACGTHVGRGHY